MTKAAVLTEYSKPLELWDIEWAPLKYGQVRVKMISSGICGAQLQEIRGEKGNHLPRLMGHEGTGSVMEVGEGVTTVLAGDMVVLHWRKGDGIESASPEWSLDSDSMYGYDRPRTAGQITTFSEETVVSENRVTKSYGDLDLCCLLGCSLSTALGTLEQEAKLKMGESLLIIGAGGLGMSLLSASKFFHASMVQIVDRHPKSVCRMPNQMEWSFSFGPWEEMIKATFDVVIDTTGDSRALEAAVERLNPSGRLIMVGQPRGAFSVKGGHRLFSGNGITIKATQGGGFQPAKDIPRYLAANLDVSGIITHRIALEGINEGIELVKRGEAGRVLITY